MSESDLDLIGFQSFHDLPQSGHEPSRFFGLRKEGGKEGKVEEGGTEGGKLLEDVRKEA
jgi:hypothetical protein